MNSINIEHYHDLGKWQFALTIFWAYIAFSQYLLIWYANIPEETIFYKHRFHGSWWWVSILVLFGHFVIPFLVLLSRGAKRNLGVLKMAALWVLFMHYVDHYWLVMPNFNREGIMPHWIDLAAFLFVGGAYGLTFWTLLRRHSLVPVGDPRFEQSLEFHNA
jgi:magnesium-transporting ATPase (P-type)